jgi:hypothetical protein
MFAGHIVLASTKSGFLPTAIKWFTKSQFSHGLITMPDLLGFPMCIEAMGGGVDMCRFDINYQNNLNEGYQIWSINLPQNVKEKALQSIIGDLEVNYGYLEYIWLIWRRLNLLFGRDIKSQNNWFSSDGLICSQLCVAYLNACGLSNVLSGYGKGSVEPADLSVIFNAHPETFTLVESVRL